MLLNHLKEETKKILVLEPAPVEERPHWGATQVRSKDEIQVGKFYRGFNVQYGYKMLFRIISIDAECCKVEWHTDCAIYEQELHFSDWSILPYDYDDGEKWNAVNWLELLDANTSEEAKEEL